MNTYKVKVGKKKKKYPEGTTFEAIAEDFKEFNLNKNDFCRLSSELLKVVSASVWEKILDK